ncbi:retrotransposon protein, putative, ty1-copia subclass [Tanacetum coccineum]
MTGFVNLSILKFEKKMFVIEQPLPAAPATDSEAQVLCGMYEKIIICIKNEIGELHAMLIEYEKGLPKKAKTPQVMMIKGGKIQKAKKKSLKASAKKPKNKFISLSLKTLNLLLKSTQLRMIPATTARRWVIGRGICLFIMMCCMKKNKQDGLSQFFREARKLKQGALYLYVGNGVRAQVEAIGSYDLVLPNGLVICLDNCHYAPSITRGVFETFKVFKNEVENQLGKTIKALRSDRGGEYISQEFKDYLKACGIVQQLTPPYTPQHNGVSERRNHTLLDMVRSMMNLTTLSLSFWDYALESATRILNMVPTKKVDKTPYELWYGKVPNLSYLKVWGCEALVKRDTPDKLQQRSVKCIFIGYPKETMGYYFYFPPENKIVVARYAEFFEKKLITQVLNNLNRNDSILGQRPHRAPNRLCLNVEVEEHSLGDLNEPASYKAAMLDSESNKWIDAMNAEIQSMMDNMVWVLVDLPPGCKTVGSRWLFKKKTDMDGIVHVYKARLVAKGYTQLYGVDYEETFSPVADIRAIRILIAIAAFYEYEIWQMDVKTAFLNGYLDEDIYMVQLKGFIDPKHPRKVCKLQRSIYDLKQASRNWNKRFDEEIKRFGFTQNIDEPCVYQKASGINVTFLILGSGIYSWNQNL